ncbi:hypothetical protein CLV24_10583 [Pontibacter ummariensis]|uniref:Uncharacterized protein n=2 Tax=Pontibacter ummariensis TaxID=1610492 RepID=A0A239DY61_9BACT|nr:hypothetical protein CLV24_10583 [Pontibacter ummariensis]SNS36938.1 hypothetical protein SAMN06296052_105168 [Pontibacter ummariensis]
MQLRTIEKLLYKIAVLLVILGAVVRFLHLSENYLGLYLILAGHIAGVVAIFLYMKYVNDMERKKQALKQKVPTIKR